MRHLFPGYYGLSRDDYARLWKQGTFVFDANVLLNLHRFPEGAREDLLNAINQLTGRLWIPFHVALEYQRNRRSVIAEQLARFVEVKGIVKGAQDGIQSKLQNLQLKKRHSKINPDTFIERLSGLVAEFSAELEGLERTHAESVQKDELRQRIDQFFDGRVGSPPRDQKALDAIHEEGEKRFARQMPPGYMDRKKEKDTESDEFCYGGLVYKRQFGDLVVWKQIIEYAKSNGTKQLVFVTDDEKEDWWWILDANGQKKVGPRPELIEEIVRETGVELFHLYTSEQFLQFAGAEFKIDVRMDSIAQVSEVKAEAKEAALRAADVATFQRLIEQAVIASIWWTETPR